MLLGDAFPNIYRLLVITLPITSAEAERLACVAGGILVPGGRELIQYSHAYPASYAGY